jgi:hypothetical protein
MAGTTSWYRWLTVATAALVLIQAVLAGRGWFRDMDLIETHGVVGNLTFIVVIAQLIFAFANRQSLGSVPLLLSAALAVLAIAQLGLGYGGRDSAEAAAWHIPNGVLIFGLAAAAVSQAWGPRRAIP